MLMDKIRRSSSRRLLARRSFSAGRSIFAVAFWLGLVAANAINLTPEEARRVGHQIWQNECNGSIAGLTSWNEGEDFASLGIGHFIWYPPGKRGPFAESFPPFLAFARSHDVDLPSWLRKAEACPWNSRAEFLRAQNSAEMRELRQFLARTVDLQTQFLIERLESSLPKMLAQTDMPQHVKNMFERVVHDRNGAYALIDYVNFKGEGTLPTERYNGRGWGLLQVLEEMRASAEGPAVAEFARAAKQVLRQRVTNSPPARHESRWLSGWLNRVNSYTRR